MSAPETQSESYDPVPASDALLAARRACSPLDGFPGQLPQTLVDAYAVQSRSLSLWGDKVVGYKVGGIPMGYRESYGGTWLAGPIFADSVSHIDDGGEGYVTVFDGGFAAYEAEYVFKVRGLRSLKGPVGSLDAAVAHIEAVHIGTEIASSPMALINDLGPGAIISDFGNNAALVVGPEVPLETAKRFGEIPVTVTIDGERIGHGPAKTAEGGPLDALRFFLDHVAGGGLGDDVPDSVLVSSGAVTGVHSAQAGTSAHIAFAELGSFTLKMVPRYPA